MNRDELQELIIRICKEQGITMNYTVSGIIVDAILEKQAWEANHEQR